VKGIAKILTVMDFWDVKTEIKSHLKNVKVHCQKCLKIKNTFFAISCKQCEIENK
jgi:hypothetical protein